MLTAFGNRQVFVEDIARILETDRDSIDALSTTFAPIFAPLSFRPYRAGPISEQRVGTV